MIRLILDKIPDIITSKANEGDTALHIAVQEDHIAIFHLLIQYNSYKK